ncbi:hypothetical protein D3C86_1742380 [compost metagenome]
MIERIFQKTFRDQTGRVGNVSHQQRTDFVGHRTQAFVIPVTAIRGCAADQKLRALFQCSFLYLIPVDQTSFCLNTIKYGLEIFT